MSIESDLKQLLERGAEIADSRPARWIAVERRIRQAHRRRLLAVLVTAAVAIAAAAVGLPQLVEEEPQGLIGPGPVIKSATTPSPEASASYSVPPPSVPAGWNAYAFEEPNVWFAYPPLVGNTTRDGHPADGGRRFSWAIERTDRCDQGVCRSYEFAAVNNGCPSSDGWPTYVHEWIEENGKYLLNSCTGTDAFEIEPLRVVVRPDGLRGIIYDASVWLSPESGIDGARAAVLNFPAGFHPEFEAIAFYFEDPTPLDTIEQVLKLVRLG
ncbi:MAG: hypothetical protein ACRDKS_07345 [Actinomycetota bacterium]